MNEEAQDGPDEQSAEPPYRCSYCDDGLNHGVPTMAVRGADLAGNAHVFTSQSARRCRACKGTGRTWAPPTHPPVV